MLCIDDLKSVKLKGHGHKSSFALLRLFLARCNNNPICATEDEYTEFKSKNVEIVTF